MTVVNNKQIPSLTPREAEIVKLVESGKTAAEIADILVVSVYTVNSHKRNMLYKYGFNNIHKLLSYVRNLANH